MTRDEKVYVEGELYLDLEVVAKIYEVQVVWLREIYGRGLLGTGCDSGQTICIQAVHLDRVATIVRLNHVLGIDLDVISRALGEALAD